MSKPKTTKKTATTSKARKGTAKVKTAEAAVDSGENGQKAKPVENLVVFAFRLLPEERNLIHKAAGPGKASRYVRALAFAASKGDEKTVVEIVRAVKTQIAS